MDELSSLPYYQFFSFKDHDGFIYGFDIISLYNLINKSRKNGQHDVKNPYNRTLIPSYIFRNISTLIRLSKILNLPIETEIEQDKTILSIQKLVELRSLELFQNIDYLGNYSNSEWFLSLNKVDLIKICGHYVLSTPQFLSDIKSNFPNIDKEIQNNINNKLNELYS
jgi:hypothetical protein